MGHSNRPGASTNACDLSATRSEKHFHKPRIFIFHGYVFNVCFRISKDASFDLQSENIEFGGARLSSSIRVRISRGREAMVSTCSRNNSSWLTACLVGISLCGVSPVAAQTPERKLALPPERWQPQVRPTLPPNTGERRAISVAPDDVANKLEESQKKVDSIFGSTPLQPVRTAWDSARKFLKETYGLKLGFGYTALYQIGDKSLPGKRREGAGGDVDVFGDWSVFNRGKAWPAHIVFSLEARHRYTNEPPSALGDNIGSIWATTSGFNVHDMVVKELFWEQGSAADGLVVRVGRIDPGGIYDGARYASSNVAFLNPGVSDTPAMAVPGPGIGIAGALYPGDDFYIAVGIHDANGTKTGRGDIDRGELFKAIEFGLRRSTALPTDGTYNITFWHVDKRAKTATPSGQGVAVSLEQPLGPDGDIVPFLRYSYGVGGATDIRQALTLGVGLENVFGKRGYLLGSAISWAQPHDRKLRDQFTAETFYRFNLTPEIQLTPSVQFIVNPSKNPTTQFVTVGGIRLRTLF